MPLKTRRSLSFHACVMLAFAWLAVAAGCSSPRDGAWVKPTPDYDGVTRIVVEAEDMKRLDGKGFGATATSWRLGRAGIDHYQNNVFGGHWQSRRGTAMTDAGDNHATLTRDITIPKAGWYKLWVKYECPPYFNYAFDVEVSRGRNMLFRKTYGLINSPKHYCFTDKLTTGSLYWTWGMDHDAAEGYELDLPAGDLTLKLIKTKNPAPAGARSIDVVMITDNLSEISSPRYSRYPLLDELSRNNHLFIRMTIPSDAASSVRANWGIRIKRYPFGTQKREMVRFYNDLGEMLMTPEGMPVVTKDAQWPFTLAPGGSTGWIDIGPTLTVESATTLSVSCAQVDDRNRTLKDAVRPAGITLEIATEPSERAVIRRFTAEKDQPVLSVLVQPDHHTAEGLLWTTTMRDIYRSVTRELNSNPRLAPVPEKMRFFSITGSPDVHGFDVDNLDDAMAFRLALGLNTMQSNTNAGAMIAAWRQWFEEQGVMLTHSSNLHHSQDPEKLAEKIAGENGTQDFYYVSYGDEIGLPRIRIYKPEAITAFHDYLRRQEVTPQVLGLPGWEQVKPLNYMATGVAVQIGVIPENSADESVSRTLKRLYWHSSQFRIEQGIADFLNKTRRVRSLMGDHVHTSANLGGMHPFFWVHQSSFIEAFRHNAMTLAWTEDYDYTQPETSRLAAEFLAGMLKAGTKYNGQRMQIYIMPHYPGQSPEHLFQNALLFWGQNIKDFDWFSTPPDGHTTENYVNPRGGMPTFRMMRHINELAGMTEAWLEPADRVDASVALLVSEASDLWEIEGKSQNAVTPGSTATNAFHEERKNTYYVLRNAGYRVDILTERDVREGRLKQYKALYFIGENIERATASVVADWVKTGGVFYAGVGTARKDEYDEPFDGLDALLGRGTINEYHRFGGPMRSKMELPFTTAMDTVSIGDEGKAFDAIITRERFTPAPGAQVIARFSDGSPAGVCMPGGAGAAYYFGVMPAAAWARHAIPLRPAGKGGPESSNCQFEPVDFDLVAAEAILKPLKDFNIQPDLRVSVPHVVTNRLQGEKASVITIVNLGRQQKGKLSNVEVEIDNVPASILRVWSTSQREGLKHSYSDGTLKLLLPELDLGSVVIIEHQP